MEACSSEQSVWAQRKGWRELELTFQVKKEKQTNKKKIPLASLPTLSRAIGYYMGLLMVLQAPFAAWTFRLCYGQSGSKGQWLLRPIALGSPGERSAQCCTDRLCPCSWESNATQDSQQCQTATSGHEMSSWSLLDSTSVGPCQDMALAQRRMDWHKVAVLSGNCHSFSSGIFQRQGGCRCLAGHSHGMATAWPGPYAHVCPLVQPKASWQGWWLAHKNDKSSLGCNCAPGLRLQGPDQRGRDWGTAQDGEAAFAFQNCLFLSRDLDIRNMSVTLMGANKSCRAKHPWLGPHTRGLCPSMPKHSCGRGLSVGSGQERVKALWDN